MVGEQSQSKINLYKLLAASTISDLGSNIYKFALAMYVLDITKSASTYTTIAVCGLLPGAIISMFVGAFVDKHNKKRIMSFSNILSGIFVLFYLILFSYDPQNIYLLMLYSATANIMQTFSNSALNASIPNIVSKENVSKANSLMQGISSIINISGPVLGAVAYVGFGIKSMMLINAISLMFSGLIQLTLKYQHQIIKKSDGKNNYGKDILEAFSYLNKEKTIKFFLVFALFVNAIYTPIRSTVITFLSYNILSFSELQVSFIQAASGIGTILGAVLVVSKKSTKAFLPKFFIYLAGQAALVFLLIIPGVFKNLTSVAIVLIYMVILITIAVLNTIQNLPLISYFQITVPEEIRGRVFSILTTSLLLFAPIGMWIYGLLLEKVNWIIILSSSSVLIIVLCIAGTLNNTFKSFLRSINDEEVVEGRAVTHSE